MVGSHLTTATKQHIHTGFQPHLDTDGNILPSLVLASNGAGGEPAPRLVLPGDWVRPVVPAQPALAPVLLPLHLEPPAEALVVVVVWRGGEAVAPHGGARGRGDQPGVAPGPDLGQEGVRVDG